MLEFAKRNMGILKLEDTVMDVIKEAVENKLDDNNLKAVVDEPLANLPTTVPANLSIGGEGDYLEVENEEGVLTASDAAIITLLVNNMVSVLSERIELLLGQIDALTSTPEEPTNEDVTE